MLVDIHKIVSKWEDGRLKLCFSKSSSSLSDLLDCRKSFESSNPTRLRPLDILARLVSFSIHDFYSMLLRS